MNDCGHSQEGEYIACIYCDIEHAGNEGYREGIIWERELFNRLWQIEMDCKCEDAMQHLKIRIERSENGIDYDLEFEEMQ